MGEEEKKLLVDIYREVGVTQEKVGGLDKKLDDHIRYTQEEFRAINELDNKQNLILAEHKQSLDVHIEGVNTLKEMYVAHRREAKEELKMLRESLDIKYIEASARISVLEKPYDLLKYIGKVAAWLIPVVGLVSGVLKALGKI